MREWPSVSIVLPAYDAEETIEECVESLLGLHYPRRLLQLVVVDNGSRDRTRLLIERRGGALTLVNAHTRGPSAARNAGIARASGQVIAFTDADCVVDPDWLGELIPALHDPTVGVAGGSIRALPAAGAVERFGEQIHDHRLAIEVQRPPYAITMSWASPRTVFDQVGMFDERLRRCEDVDLSYRILAAGFTLAFRPTAVVYHRNERSLGGLFREGWQHGYHAVPVRRKHARLIAESRAGCGGKTSGASAKRNHYRPGGYEHVFAAGKRIGRAIGELRFRCASDAD